MKKDIKLNTSFYPSVKLVANIDRFRNEFELWLNANKEFVFLWEGVLNDLDGDYMNTDDYIEIDNWAQNESKSLLINPEDEEDFIIHPQILLAFSIDDPVVKLNLVTNIFELPQKHLNAFIHGLFGLEKKDK